MKLNSLQKLKSNPNLTEIQRIKPLVITKVILGVSDMQLLAISSEMLYQSHLMIETGQYSNDLILSRLKSANNLMKLMDTLEVITPKELKEICKEVGVKYNL